MLETVLGCVFVSAIDKLWIIDHSPSDSLKSHVPVNSRVIYRHCSNRGYGAGNNIAIQEAIRQNFKYHLVLNPDIYWKGDIVSPLMRFMDENGDTGMLMPKILYPDGKFQYQAKLLPTPLSLFCKRFLPGRLKKRTVNKYELRNIADWGKSQNLPYLSGCFMFLRINVLKEIGGFDERFFMYPEDIDLTRRIHEKFKTLYYPDVTVFHRLDRGSTHSLRLFMIHAVNMCRYFNKWGWIKDSGRTKINEESIRNINS